MDTSEHIDELRLDEDVEYRMRYLQMFLDFDEDARREIHAACPLLVPRLPAMVDTIYGKMLAFDATRRHFAVGHTGYTSDVPAGPEAVSPDHEIIRFRKRALIRYFTELLLSDLDGGVADWMDTVGRMHTSKAGAASIHIPLIQVNAMMGFMADTFIGEIAALDLAPDARLRLTRAISKLFWLQNDFLSRHYA